MWSTFVVVGPPSFHLLHCVLQSQEPVFVQALDAEPTVERFNQGIIHWLSRAAEVELHAVGVSPLIVRPGDVLRTVVDTD